MSEIRIKAVLATISKGSSRALGFPNVFTWLQCYRLRRHSYALGKDFSKNDWLLGDERARGKGDK